MTRFIPFAWTLSALISIVFLPAGTARAEGTFPWDGEITGSNVNVRSGKGTAYYATMQLNDGDKVTVVAEDQGWYQIIPPLGSFSYIDRSAVERHTNDLGTVIRDKSYVRAGSKISRRKSQTQITLNNGDPVVILGESDGFYKIEPPQGVVHFVSKEYVRPFGSKPVVTEKPVDTSKPIVADMPIPVSTDDPAPIKPEVVIRSTPPTTTDRPVTTSGSTSNTLVINAAGSKATARKTESRLPIAANQPKSTQEDPNAPLVIDASNSTTSTDTYSSDQGDDYDLTPAERRPPATIPDWASDGNTISSSSTTSTTTTTTISSNGTGAAYTPATPSNSNTQVKETDSDTLYMTATEMTPVTSHAASSNTATTTTTDTTPVDNRYISNSSTETTYVATTSTTNNTAPARPVNDPYAVNTSTSSHSHLNEQPPEFTPPPIPIDPASGPYAAQLVDVEHEMHNVFRMPIASRPYEQLIQKYRNIAAQSDEPVPAQYAEIRATQIENLDRIRKLTLRYSEDSTSLTQFQSQMSSSRISTLSQSGGGYMANGARFDYVGELRKSYAFEPERNRFRIVNPETETTIIYLDVPPEVMSDARTLLGRRVGVRISGQRFSEAARVPIAEAVAIVEIAAGVLAEPIPNSGNVWNGQNTSLPATNTSADARIRGYDSGEVIVGTMTPVD